MTTPNPASLIKTALEWLASAVSFGSNTRSKLLSDASAMASAIQMASALCTVRLAEALAEQDPQKKRSIMSSLGQQEIGQMAQVQHLCGPIATAATQLTHAISAEWANVNLGTQATASQVFLDLQKGEWALQEIFRTSLVPPSADPAIDPWLRQTMQDIAEVGTAASNAVIALTRKI